MPKPFDIDVDQWLDGIGFHPANSEAKQLAHQAARNLIAQLGLSLYQLLPAGRDKSLAFTHLEDVLMRANRALAVAGGPKDGAVTDDLRRVANASYAPSDARIEQYKAEQLGRG